MTTGGSPRVIVEDVGVDALLTGDGVLVLRPGQSFDHAVEAVRELLPAVHEDQVRRLVRSAMPGAPTMRGLTDPGSARRPAPAPSPGLGRVLAARQPGGAPTWKAGLAWAGVVAGGLLAASLAYQGLALAAGLPVAGGGAATASQEDPPGLFDHARFAGMGEAMGVYCPERSDMGARCAVTGGQHAGHLVVADVVIASTSLVYRFQHVEPDSVAGPDVQRRSTVTVRVFPSEAAATVWVLEMNAGAIPVASDPGAYANLVQADRFVVYGSNRDGVQAAAASLPGQSSIDEELPAGWLSGEGGGVFDDWGT